MWELWTIKHLSVKELEPKLQRIITLFSSHLNTNFDLKSNATEIQLSEANGSSSIHLLDCKIFLSFSSSCWHNSWYITGWHTIDQFARIFYSFLGPQLTNYCISNYLWLNFFEPITHFFLLSPKLCSSRIYSIYWLSLTS